MSRSVDIVIPVYSGNREELEACVYRLIPLFEKKLNEYEWRITISVNGSGADSILELARKIQSQKPERVRYLYIGNAGKGYGVFSAWEKSHSDVMAYMDVDLSTNPNDIDALIKPIAEKSEDMVVGARYHPDSKVSGRGIRSYFEYLQLLICSNFTQMSYHRPPVRI
jgi:glycosyltransferase involved in cell wall biosynthesis